jgi:hypothetical protein
VTARVHVPKARAGQGRHLQMSQPRPQRESQAPLLVC